MENLRSIFVRPIEAAALLSVSKSKLYEMLARGEIPSTRIGGMLRVPRAAIEQLAKEALGSNVDSRS